MVPAGVVESTLEQLAAASSKPTTSLIDGGNSYSATTSPGPRTSSGTASTSSTSGDERRRVGPGPGYCLMDRRRGRAGTTPEPHLPDDRARQGHRRAHPGFGALGHRRAGLSALRAVRGGPLRQDGAQRHRIRPDGRDRLRACRHPGRGRGPAHGRNRRGDRAACATLGLPVRDRTSATWPRCGAGAR